MPNETKDRSLRSVAALILAAALLVRVAGLGSNPASMFRDEAEKAYSAWSLLDTGGVLDFTQPLHVPGIGAVPRFESWPLFHNVWGSHTSMAYQYAALPLVAIGGMNEWTTRLPAALAGTLTVLMAFLLARALTGSTRVALAAMAFLAFSPWHLVFSRWAQQGVLVPLFVSAGLLAFLRAFHSRRALACFTLGAIGFGLAFYTYSGTRPFLIVFWLLLGLIWRRDLLARKREFLPALALLAVLLLPTILAMLGGGGEGLGRWRTVSVWSMDAPIAHRLLLFLKNYLSHFSPQFLFLTGDANLRHSVPWFGQMLLIEAPFLIAGLYVALKRRSTTDRLLLGWFLLFPLSAAMTREGIPHALRTLHAVPCPHILAGIGFGAMLEWGRAKERMGLVRSIGFVWGLNAVAFLALFFLRYPAASASAFDYAPGLAAQEVRERRGDTGALHILPSPGLLLRTQELYLFHLRVSPSGLRNQAVGRAPVRFLAPQDAAGLNRVVSGLRTGDAVLMGGEEYRWWVKESKALPPHNVVRFQERPVGSHALAVVVIHPR